MKMNEAKLERGMGVRSVITFEDTYSREQFIVLEKSEEDTMYTVAQFSDSIIKECEEIMSSSYTEKEDGYYRKYLLTEKISKYLNMQERKNSNVTLNCISNPQGLKGSYIINC